MSKVTFSKSELLEIMLEAKDRIDPSERADFMACLKARWGDIDWCRCAGKGYWHEQIDGPDNLRLVRCPKHWAGEEAKK